MSGLAVPQSNGTAVPLRRRVDLVLRPSFASPTKAWLVKDPVASRYFELPEEEHFIWQRLDGRTTWNELRDQFEATFAPRQLSGAGLLQILDDLFRRGLITSDRPGQAQTLRRRGEVQRRRDFFRRFANPLAICLPGIDPQPLLSRIPSQFSSSAARHLLVGCFTLCLLAIVTLTVYFEDARRELTTGGPFPAEADWPVWIAAILVAKVIHEAAHAWACRRCGGECREIGLMLLCGMPCLYCDVTSMWMTPERWKRIAVSAAGVFAEVVLAATAVLLWRFSEPGMLHSLCLHLAIVCSVGTILVNANPLLRYDGYFVLADLLGVTNLGERANRALYGELSLWFFGSSSEDDSVRPENRRAGLALYAFASAAYRCLLTLCVLWIVRQALVPHGLRLLSDALTLAAVGGLSVPPLRRLAQRIQQERRERRGGMFRFVGRSAAVVCLLTAFLMWPWPYRITAPAVTCLHDAEYLYVVTGGRLTEAVDLGTKVEAGDRIALLEDPQLQLELAKLDADVARRRLEIANLERLRVADPAQANALPTAHEFLKGAERQRQHLQHEQDRLQIVASRAGTVLPQLASHAQSNSREATSTAASPLEPSRRGVYLTPGTPLCAVGDPQRLEAQVTVDQHEIEFVRSGQVVRLRFDAAPGQTLTGRIVEIAEVEFDELPRPTSADGKTAENETSQRVPTTKTRYLARVVLDEPAADLPVGAVGRAKIEAASQSFGARLWRTFSSTFRFVWNAT